MASKTLDVRLVDPTDFEILERMRDGERYTGEYLASLLDKRGQYMNNRLASLRSNGLVTRVDDSKMHIITDNGRAALELRERYSHDTGEEFAALVRERAQELAGGCSHDNPNGNRA
jgi:DNA-binding transcriptional ArsR family regulator